MSVFRMTSLLPLRNAKVCNLFNQNLGKKMSTTCAVAKAAYDPDGKTVVNILNDEENAPLMVNAYNNLGFRLNNGLFAVGPVVLFPRTVLSWNVKDEGDINEHTLSLFFHLAPKLDVLVIGLTDARNQKLLQEIRTTVYQLMTLNKVSTNFEVLPTEKAVTTFNFLNAEDRFVAAALLPPIYFSPTPDDQFRVDYLTKKRKENDFLLD